MILAGAHWSWTPYHVARKIDMVKELQLSLWLVGWVHGRGKDIFQGGPAGEFPKIFSGGPKVVVFTPRNWKKTCFASKFTIQGAFPPFRRPWLGIVFGIAKQLGVPSAPAKFELQKCCCLSFNVIGREWPKVCMKFLRKIPKPETWNSCVKSWDWKKIFTSDFSNIAPLIF